MAEALAAAAIWLLCFAAAAVITAARPRLAAARPPDALPPPGPRPAAAPAGPATRPPALLNLCVTRGKLDGAAYAATILDLAAHGGLILTEPEAGRPRCALPPAPAGDPGLAGFERLVLATVTGRLTADGPAPLEALAGRCTADVPGTWDPFERAVRREGRQCGLTRPRLPATVTGLLYAGAATLGLLTFLAVSARPHSGLWAALTAAFFAILLPAYWVRSVARQDRLTGPGAALAAWSAAAVPRVDRRPARREHRRCTAARECGGAPREGGGGARSAAGGRHLALWAQRKQARRAAGRGQGRHLRALRAGRPRAAWSSRSGEWRLVDVPAPGLPLRSNPGALLAAAAWAGLLCYPASLLPGMAGALVLAVLAAAVLAAGAGGVLALARWLAQPAEATFDGQVIARWVERRGSGDDDVYVPCFAVDDGQRAWSADTSRGAFGRLSVGDAVRVRASPRSGKLLGLDTPGAAPSGQACEARPAVTDPVPAPGAARAGTGLPSGSLLLTAGEAAQMLGGPVREIPFSPPFGAGVIYRRGGATVTVTVAGALLGAVSAGPARHAGPPLAGVGDEAWLLNDDRTAVVCVAGLTAKITFIGWREPAHAGVLPGLAAAVAARLSDHVTRP